MSINNTPETEDTGTPKGALEGMPPSDVMVIYPNPEKRGPVRLGLEEYMPLATSRILLSGPPGSGKRNVILNLVRRMLPPPSVCHLVHHDPNTEEYDILTDWGLDVLTYGPHDFPTLDNIENPWGDEDSEGGGASDEADCTDDDNDAGEEKDREHKQSKKVLSNPLVIVDEVTADLLGKKGCSRFERMVNHVCTHRNTTLICSIQSAASIPASVRRGFNHFGLWKQPDEMLNKILARRTSITPAVLSDLFRFTSTPHEFIWIDLDSPLDSDWRYRYGYMIPIRITPRYPGDDVETTDQSPSTAAIS